MIPDIITRLKAALPARWFPDATPVLDALLTGLATPWAALLALIADVRAQSRVATTTGSFLDGASRDYLGARLPRRPSEPDGAFRIRLQLELRRPRATRAALVTMLTDLTGRPPAIYEPSRPADTGGYSTNALAYGATGAWGSLQLPFQVFVTARRSNAASIANVAGYGTGGPLTRGDLTQISGQVTDADIYAAVTSVLPAGITAWTQITN